MIEVPPSHTRTVRGFRCTLERTARILVRDQVTPWFTEKGLPHDWYVRAPTETTHDNTSPPTSITSPEFSPRRTVPLNPECPTPCPTMQRKSFRPRQHMTARDGRTQITGGPTGAAGERRTSAVVRSSWHSCIAPHQPHTLLCEDARITSPCARWLGTDREVFVHEWTTQMHEPLSL